MSIHAVGGWLERSAVLFFNPASMQRWMLRAIAILLGVATTRPVMGVFFATSRLSHLTPRQFFGLAFWIGFSLNILVIELWIRHRPASATA